MMFLLFRLRQIAVVLVALSAALSHAQVRSPEEIVPGRFLLHYRSGRIPRSVARHLQVAGGDVLLDPDALGISVVQVPPEQAEALRTRLQADPDVDLVVADRVVRGDVVHVQAAMASNSADALYNSPQGWAVRQVGGLGNPGPWNITTGRGIRIAVLDSGVDATHPDLAPNLALNLSEVSHDSTRGIPSTCDDGTPQDQQGHGTWAASLAAGAMGPGTGAVAGVAPSATILNIKVMQRMPGTPTAADPSGCNSGQASGLLSWVLAGIEDAIANQANVISMSLGAIVDITTGDGAGLRTLFDQVTHAAANAGVLLIASAGNDGYHLANQRYIELPAQARDVLAIVASTNPACAENLLGGAVCAAGPVTLPYYSNYGSVLQALAAPGGSYPAGPDADLSQPSGWIWGACSSGIPSTVTGPPADSSHSFGCFGLGHQQYVQAMGTSASTPLAAGAAALVWGANPTWSASTVMTALRAAAVAVPGLPSPLIDAAAIIHGSANTGQQGQHINAGPRR
jgi:subtilisin family serine protease